MSFAISTLEQGLVYGIMALGVYISFKIINFADLTVEGSFTLGAAVTAKLITSGANPVFSIFISIIAGGLAGLITGFLNTKLKITELLAGILTMTALYSINLRIMGKSNIPMLSNKSIFDYFDFAGSYKNILFFGLIVFFYVVFDKLFFANQDRICVKSYWKQSADGSQHGNKHECYDYVGPRNIKCVYCLGRFSCVAVSRLCRCWHGHWNTCCRTCLCHHR